MTRSTVSEISETAVSYPGSRETSRTFGSARTFSATSAFSSSWFSSIASEMFFV